MSDLGSMMAAAFAAEILIIIAVAAIVFGGIGWAIGHFLL